MGEVSSTRENIETNSEDVSGRDIGKQNFDLDYFGVDSFYPGITVNKASYNFTIYILKNILYKTNNYSFIAVLKDICTPFCSYFFPSLPFFSEFYKCLSIELRFFGGSQL